MGHLSRTCTLPGKAHAKLGIEIEGFWRDVEAARRLADERGMSGNSDGSLSCDVGNMEAWEFQTVPGSLGEAISQLTALYPDGTNNSAGMHVHLSFTDVISATALYSLEFMEFFTARWREWGTRIGLPEGHQFWHRLAGRNQYCQVNSESDFNRPVGQGNRYRLVNFTSWDEHSTVECRLLPMFRDLRVAISAMEELVAIVEDWLAVPRLAGECQMDTLPRPTISGEVRRELTVDLGVARIAGNRTVNITRAAAPPIPPGHRRYFGPTAVVADRVLRAVIDELRRQEAA